MLFFTIIGFVICLVFGIQFIDRMIAAAILGTVDKVLEDSRKAHAEKRAKQVK